MAGRETSLTDPVGNKTQWAYDSDDRMTTQTQPNGQTVTNVYDSDGELTDTTDEDGRRTTFSYNADGDQTGETWVGASPSEKITYTYDADNEMTGATRLLRDAYLHLQRRWRAANRRRPPAQAPISRAFAHVRLRPARRRRRDR